MAIEMIRFDSRSCFFILVIINVVENKRYDIEQHCMEEYGLDLDGVLRQFRRSDDYLQILTTRTEEFGQFFMDVLIQSSFRYLELMDKKIAEEIGIEDDTPSTTLLPATTTTPALKLRKRQKFLKTRRQYRGKDSGEDAAKKLEKVQRLDEYVRLNSHLTVDERNHYKNIGFTFAGDIIHDIIRAFDGDPLAQNVQSTRGPLLDDKSETITTEHQNKHVPTNANVTIAEPTARLRRGSRFALVSRRPIKMFGR